MKCNDYTWLKTVWVAGLVYHIDQNRKTMKQKSKIKLLNIRNQKKIKSNTQ